MYDVSNNEIIRELVSYIHKIESIIKQKPDLHYYWRSNGPNVSQIAFHTAEAVRYWLGELILSIPSGRNRAEEFVNFHSYDKIKKSFEKCNDLFELFNSSEIDLNKPIKVLTASDPSVSKTWNVMLAIIHITAHSAEHYGQMKFLTKL